MNSDCRIHRGDKVSNLGKKKPVKVIEDFLEVILNVNGNESEAEVEIKFINFKDNV